MVQDYNRQKKQAAKQCGMSDESKHKIRGQYQRTVGLWRVGLTSEGLTDVESRLQETGAAETQSSYTSY